MNVFEVSFRNEKTGEEFRVCYIQDPSLTREESDQYLREVAMLGPDDPNKIVTIEDVTEEAHRNAQEALGLLSDWAKDDPRKALILNVISEEILED